MEKTDETMGSGKKKTAVEVYLSAVFKWGIITLVSACMCATVMFTTEKLMGLCEQVAWSKVVIFALMDITFFIFWGSLRRSVPLPGRELS